jgi:alkanesulfonate monooxygenase SsuD/methylene tetrahydromethanopterin reductase-like flavin-dependent oxidoreductase (luciferase family)
VATASGVRAPVHDVPMTSLGVVFIPNWPPEGLRAVAVAAEESGLDELWLWEDCFRESGLAPAAAVLAWTERLKVGVGLYPAPLRNVALTAMELASVERLFPGRHRVGVGHGVQEWMGQIGARVESPLTLLREYVVALHLLLAGERVTTDGRYVHLEDVALEWPPATHVPIHVGAVGPKTLELSGEVADGTIMTGGTLPAEVRAARVAVDAGRAKAGRTDVHPLTVYLMAATGAGAEERLHREIRRWDLNLPLDAGAAGDAAAIAAGVDRWAQAGADTVVLQPTEDEPDIEGFVRFVAQEVKPLVGRSLQ